MGATRRTFTLEFKTDAAHWVIDTGRSVQEVARELSVGEDSLYRWVRDKRRRREAAMSAGEEPLSPKERQELMRLRRELEELCKDNAFSGKAAAHNACKSTKQERLALMEAECAIIQIARDDFRGEWNYVISLRT